MKTQLVDWTADLLPSDWRLGAYLGREQQLASPYYGIGNNTVYDSTNERPPNPYFYRYGRTGPPC